MYETDFGAYPTDGVTDSYTTTTSEAENPVIIQLLSGTDASGTVLSWADPGDANYNANWKGPYFKVSQEDIDANGWLLDPWGKQYVIVFDRDNNASTHPPYHNTLGIDIFSLGPDGTTSSGGTDNDSYTEWINDPSDGDSDASDNYSYNDDDINNW